MSSNDWFWARHSRKYGRDLDERALVRVGLPGHEEPAELWNRNRTQRRRWATLKTAVDTAMPMARMTMMLAVRPGL
jgi:hypothetical protein